MYYLTYYKSMHDYNPYATIEDRRKELAEIKGRKNTITVERVDTSKITPVWYSQDYYEAERAKIMQKYDTDEITYTTFQIPKRSGGMRNIEAPNEFGKAMQRLILHILRDRSKILEHDAAYGFVKNRNCKKALIQHQLNKSEYFLKLDIDNFFPSLTEYTVISNLYKLAQATVSWNFINSMANYMFYEGRLSQGSPLSPYLANLTMLPFDYRLSKYAAAQGMVYTRYADDILLSSASPIKVRRTIDVVKDYLMKDDLNLQLKEAKTRYGTCKGRNWNLGIMYNKDMDITVGHEAKHTMKVIAHKWDSLSDEDKQHFQGLLSYYKSIEPDYFNQERFNIIRIN